jgi:gamma-glutamylcyclotransferase (GGCT)/AIG2-like uncharacterized protein YtfP
VTRVPHPPAVTDRRLPLLLAVYGTLRRGCRNAHVLGGAQHVADGWVRGRLHEVTVPLGRDFRYPLLLVVPEAGGDLVRVEAYRVEAVADLTALDALEAYDPDDVAASEYVRVALPLLDGGGRATGLDVQVYAYAGDAAGVGTPLPGGDWCAHAGAVA